MREDGGRIGELAPGGRGHPVPWMTVDVLLSVSSDHHFSI